MFAEVADTFRKLEETSKRLEMTSILADLFKKTPASDIDKVVYLLQGRVAPAFKNIEIGIGEKLAEQAISKATGYPVKEVEKKYHELGDLGLVAEKFVSKKKQKSLFSQDLTVKHVFNAFYKMATVSGARSQDLKIKTLVELLNNSKPLEARYIIRIPLGKLSLGVGDPTILDALATAVLGDKTQRSVLEEAYNVCSDLGLVAKTLYEKGLEGVKNIRVRVGVPLRPALCERLPTAEEIIKKLGKCAAEHKYDGFRIAIHKNGDDVRIFSRREEEMTHMFPEVVKAVREQVKAKQTIIEGEAIGYNEATGEFLPFQVTIQRKRKHGIEKKAKEYPLKVFLFDVLYVDGEDVRNKPFKERRNILEKIIKPGETLKLAEEIITDNAEELKEFFEDAISRGLEGIVAKDLNAPYTTGARKFAWIKMKRSYKGELGDTVDVVIVGYYAGKGMRTKLGFGGLLTAVYDDEADEFKTIARVGSGFSEEQMKELKQLLDKVCVKQKPKNVDSLVKPDYWVEPKYVAEVLADEITKSPMHTCGMKDGVGYALRFPRMIRLREDKTPYEATTVREIIRMYEEQKKTRIEE